MSTYNTVLVAIDLYGNPEQVLDKAASLSKQFADDAKLYIQHVPFDPAYLGTGYMGMGMGISYPGTTGIDREEVQKETRERMQALLEKTDLHPTELISEPGRAAEEIIAQAEKIQADLIILGSHGRHGIGLLLGSTANSVLHKAKCDVLAVRMKEG